MNNQSWRARTLTVASILVFSIALDQVAAQTHQQPQLRVPASTSSGEPANSPSVIVSPDADYRIGPRDVIEIRIEDAAELSNVYQVNADGTFLMPYLKRINAKDKTPEELSTFIADALRGRYLKDPQFLVIVRQYYSHTFFIQGSVKKPGSYQMEGRPTLLQLIAAAGGLAENHGSSAFIIHEVKDKKTTKAAVTSSMPGQASPVVASQPATPSDEDGPEYTFKAVNISGLFKGRFDQNAIVEPSDIVNIPQSDVFFVAGEVNAPGSFPLSDGTTLRQAIALSQGTTLNAALANGTIFRQDPTTGRRLEIQVDIGAVMKGRKEDLIILANDVVMVRNSRAKSIGNSILRAFGMGAAQRGIRPY